MKGVKALALLVLVLYALPSFGAHVAGYLKIDGVPGSSKDPAHLGWMELLTFSFALPNSPSSPACSASNFAAFTVAEKPTAGSGETKIRQMCRARTPVPLMRVDIPGLAGGPHMLQNVQFTGCKENGEQTGDYEQIRYSSCSAHHRPAPNSGIGSPQRERPAR